MLTPARDHVAVSSNDDDLSSICRIGLLAGKRKSRIPRPRDAAMVEAGDDLDDCRTHALVSLSTIASDNGGFEQRSRLLLKHARSAKIVRSAESDANSAKNTNLESERKLQLAAALDPTLGKCLVLRHSMALTDDQQIDRAVVLAITPRIRGAGYSKHARM